MMTDQYFKLVRDKIPEILKDRGLRCSYRVLDRGGYRKLLVSKLYEEIGEFIKDGDPEELVDILEVVYAIAEEYGYSEKDINSHREYKKNAKGGFKERILLEEIFE